MNPQDQNFDWVKATVACTLRREFQELSRLARENYDAFVSPEAPANPATFEYRKKSDPEEFFIVRRTENDATHVCFRLNGNKIAVLDITRHSEKLRFTVTVGLNRDGECRYRISNKEGEFLRWQVLREALEHLFFKS